MEFGEIAEAAGQALDLAGVAVIVLGALVATVLFLPRVRHRDRVEDAFRRYRQGLGRAILLGLEFLVAGDIIRTVAVSPTFRGVGVLAVIVLIRTFLSLSLQVELEGRWPWRRGPGHRAEHGPPR